MNHAISIIEMKRELYVKKRIHLLERKTELLNQGKKIEATALDFAIDRVQQFISDLTGMISEIKNYDKYTEMCTNLITLNNKKNGIN